MISVVVGTFGDITRWGPLADRALASLAVQTVEPRDIQHIHERTLAGARNRGALSAKGEWLCFLDADDELDSHYIEAMQAVAATATGPALLQPATLGVVNGVEDSEPVIIPERPLREANYMVIGTLVRRDQFLRVNGFRELPVAEDWDLWCRCRIDGAPTIPVPDAVYRVHVNTESRNTMSATYIATYNDIRRQYASLLEDK